MAIESIELARTLAAERIDSFFDLYDDAGLDFAAHCAFPLTLTTELTYYLREKFAPDLHWSIAPQLLLSSLCGEVGADLYAMDLAVRGDLLIHLVDRFTDRRLDELATVMAAYIKAGVGDESNYRSQIFGKHPKLIKYTALALFKRDNDDRNIDLIEQIEDVLQKILSETDDPRERFLLARSIESQGNLLAAMGFEAITIERLQFLARSTAENRSVNEFDRVVKAIATAGFPSLQSKEIEAATISFEESAIDSGDALYQFEFETVRVDERGSIVSREQGQAYAFKEPLTDEIGLEMVAIPSGKFMMGSPESEPDRWEDESPQHEVTIARPFFIGKYPITQAHWWVIANTPAIERELNPEPSRFKGDNLPVENVSWEDAVEFCQRLSRQTGRDYRLPTEAEWEYAARAGTTTPFYFGQTITGKLANYNSDYTYARERKVKRKRETTPVGDFPPNRFGLSDMHGNVWEWCLDHWHGNYQGAPTDGSAWLSEKSSNTYVLRGGSWDIIPRNCRSATRDYYTPVFRSIIIGFRVVCETPRTS